MKKNQKSGGYFSKYSRLSKGSVLIVIAAIFAVSGFFVSHANAQVDPDAALGVTGITAIANSSGTVGYATADNTYADGWRWVFNVTVPNGQTLLKMKFADWVNGSNIIPAGGNIQIYSAQSTNATSEANAIPITASSAWSGLMNIDPNTDLDVNQGGRQIQIVVEAKIPTGSAGGSYSTSYGINTTATSSISFSNLTQTYNGTPEAVSITTTPANLATNVTYTGINGTTYGLSTTAPTHVGTYAVNAMVTDPGYTGTSTATLTINPAPISVVADPQTKVYDNNSATDPILTPNLTTGLPALFGSDTFTGVLARNPGENVDCYNITQGTLALDSDYILTVSPSTFCITQAGPLTISGLTANNKPYDGNMTATISGTPVLNGIIGTDVVTLVGTPVASFADKIVGTGKSVTVNGYTLGGADAGNYTLTQPTGLTANIIALPITASIKADDKVYNGNSDATTKCTPVGFISSDSVTCSAASASFADKNVNTDITVTATGITLGGTDAGNYTLGNNTTANTAANIAPAPLRITANDASKTYGDEKTFVGTEFTSTGLASGDVISSVTLTSDGAAPISAVGTYPITPSAPLGINLTDYTPKYIDGTLTVNTAPVTVTIDPKTKVYDNNPVTDPKLTYEITSGSLFNNDQFSGSLTRTPGEIVSSYPITQGSLTLGSNYDLIVIPSSFTITASTSVVSLSNLKQTYGSVTPVTVTTDPTGLSNSVTYNGSLTEPTNAGTYTVVATVTDSNYIGSTTGSLIISPLPITVTAVSDTKTYDGTISSKGKPMITSATTLVSGDNATWMQTFDTKDVGTGKTLTPAGTVSDNNSGNNYVVTFVQDKTGSITPATTTVSATGNDKVYDGSAAATVNLTVNGAVGSDKLTATPGKAMFVGSTPFNGKDIGTHPISITGIVVTGLGVTSDDYTYNTSTSTSATITAKGLTISDLTVNDKIYNQDTKATLGGNPTLVGVISPDVITLDGTHVTANFADDIVNPNKPVTLTGDYTISGTKSGDYTLTQPSGLTGNIIPLAITGTITSSDKTYDGTPIASTSCSLSGVLTGDVVNCVTSNSVFNTRNAGPDPVKVSANLALSGADSANYSVNETATTNATIKQLAITVTAQASSRTYDGNTDSTIVPTSTPALGQGDTANFIEKYDTKNVGTGKTLTPSGVVSDGNNGNNYSYTFASSTNGVINAEPLTITAQPSTKVYDGTASSTVTPTITGTIFGTDSKNFTETYVTSTVGSGIVLTPSGNVNDGFGGADYTYDFVTNDNGAITQATPLLSYRTNELTDGENYTLSTLLDNPLAYIIDHTHVVQGIFTSNPSSGTVSGTTTPLQIEIIFTPTDTTDFSTVKQEVTFTVVSMLPPPVGPCETSAGPCVDTGFNYQQPTLA